ncbi:MAG: Thiamine-monophosphate kinase, partial [bacterium]
LVNRDGLRSERLSLGIGDDTASFLPRPGYELLVTCDSMIEGRHYLPQHISFMDLGRRAMTLNISDIGAMGGTPLYALISLGLRAEMFVRDVEEIYRGFIAELNPFGASIIGGNLTRGAKPGDAILVTGYPGQAAAGFQLLLQTPNDPSLARHPLVTIYNRPSHRAHLGKAIAQTGFAIAMIDTSDGFLGDLGHICEESGVGAELFKDKIPVSEGLYDAARILHRDPYDFFLGESDDYELIITCHPQHVALLCSIAEKCCAAPLTEVGMITGSAPGITLLLPDGERRPVKSLSWDHFRSANDPAE